MQHSFFHGRLCEAQYICRLQYAFSHVTLVHTCCADLLLGLPSIYTIQPGQVPLSSGYLTYIDITALTSSMCLYVQPS